MILSICYCVIYFCSFLSFFIFDRPPCSHRVLRIGWWSSNTRTEATETLEFVILLYLICYFVSHVVGSLLHHHLSPRKLFYHISFRFAAANSALAPSRSRTSCYHHILATPDLSTHTVSSHRSRIGRVAMYCSTVFGIFRTY